MHRAGLPATVVWAIALLAAGPSAQQPPQPPPLSSLPLRLTGVMVDDKSPANSSCFVRCLRSDERHGALRVGDEACGIAEIKEIHSDGLVIRNLQADRVEFLAFPVQATRPPAATEPQTAAPAKAAPPPASSETVAVDISKASVEHYLGNLNEVLASAVAVPHYRDGANGQRVMDGFEMTRIKEGGAAEQLGLQNGDVVLEVNGQALDGIGTAMALLGQVPSMTQAKLAVRRNGQPMTFVINVK